MFKTTHAWMILLASVGTWSDGTQDGERVRFKEESITIEYTATSDEATIVFAAESETAMQRIQIRDPLGRRVGSFNSSDGHGLHVSGYVLEAAEGTRDEILATYRPGPYAISGRTPDGRVGEGSATLRHRLLEPPALLYPVQGAEAVPTTFTVGWLPDPDAVGYRLNLEQGDSDTLAVRLPADTTSFQVPAGVLAPGTPTLLEVGAVASNGNCTLVEIQFLTR